MLFNIPRLRTVISRLLHYEAVYDFGFRQKEIADHLGLHNAYVSRLLSEKKQMPRTNLCPFNANKFTGALPKKVPVSQAVSCMP